MSSNVAPFKRDRALLSVRTDKENWLVEIIDGQTEQVVLAVMVDQETIAKRDEVLGLCSLIGRVTNANENETVVKAQLALTDFVKWAEAGKVQVKKAPWDYCTGIDELFRAVVSDVKKEQLRLARLAGNYQDLEEAKTRASNNLRSADLEANEAERQRALSQCQTHEQRDAIEEEFANRAASLPKAVPERAEGQGLKYDWEIEITDPVAFIYAHPNLAKIEIKLREAKALLDAGQELKGVKATKIPKGTVRSKRSAEPQAA